MPNSNVGTGMAAFSELPTKRKDFQSNINLIERKFVYLLQSSLDILEDMTTFL